jgi:hypothetical protein
MKAFCAGLAALLTLAPARLASAQELGTLFTKPEERAYMDYLREEFLMRSQEDGFNIDAPEIPEVPVDEPAQQESAAVEFSFGGIMARRDGSRSVWLNNNLLAESALPAGISIAAGPRSIALRIAQGDKIFLLRPGQSVNMATGVITEAYQRAQSAPPVPAPTEADSSEAESAVTTVGAAPEPAGQAAPAPAPESDGSGSDLVPLAEALLQLSPEQSELLSETLRIRQEQADALE